MNKEMNKENLIKSGQSFSFFLRDLRDAHTDAINTGSRFEELSIFRVLEQASLLEQQLNRVLKAAGVK